MIETSATVLDFYKAQRYLRADSVHRGTVARMTKLGIFKRARDLKGDEPSIVVLRSPIQ